VRWAVTRFDDMLAGRRYCRTYDRYYGSLGVARSVVTKKTPPKPSPLASVFLMTCGCGRHQFEQLGGATAQVCASQRKSSRKSCASVVMCRRVQLGRRTCWSGPKSPRLPGNAGAMDRVRRARAARSGRMYVVASAVARSKVRVNGEIAGHTIRGSTAWCLLSIQGWSCGWRGFRHLG
jgi:hypothetical protein